MASSPTIPPLGTVPSGQTAPVEVISSTDHGAWIVIATALGLTLGLVALLIRFYVRVIISPPFSRDDYIHCAATVGLTELVLQRACDIDSVQAFALIQSIVVFFAVSKGFGKSIELVTPRDLVHVQQVIS